MHDMNIFLSQYGNKNVDKLIRPNVFSSQEPYCEVSSVCTSDRRWHQNPAKVVGAYEFALIDTLVRVGTSIIV